MFCSRQEMCSSILGCTYKMLLMLTNLVICYRIACNGPVPTSYLATRTGQLHDVVKVRGRDWNFERNKCFRLVDLIIYPGLAL